MREQITPSDLWDLHSRGAWIVVPTNGSVRRDGCLVMGRGLAEQAARRYPGLQLRLGKIVELHGNVVHILYDYQLITFPVKHIWNQRADLDLIKESAQSLVRAVDIIEEVRLRIHDAVYLPRVGCGNGRLRWEHVKLVLEKHLDARFVVVDWQPLTRKE